MGILPSMGQTGYCYDNAGMEAFWSTLKSELLPDDGVFESLATARICLFEYIEVYYNRKRRHSSLHYLSPENYERAVKLAKLPDVIRGYEQVKLKNVARFREEVQKLKKELVPA